jgi:hypothetical protein
MINPVGEEFGRLKLGFFKDFLELPNGIPDESAFRRVLQCLDPRQLQEGLENWLVDIKQRKKGEEGEIEEDTGEGRGVYTWGERESEETRVSRTILRIYGKGRRRRGRGY